MNTNLDRRRFSLRSLTTLLVSALGSDSLETTPALTTTLHDSHFVTRDRLGRLVAFLARMTKDVGPKSIATARAIGVNEQTALMISNGSASVIGNCGLPGSTASLNLISCIARVALNGDRA